MFLPHSRRQRALAGLLLPFGAVLLAGAAAGPNVLAAPPSTAPRPLIAPPAGPGPITTPTPAGCSAGWSHDTVVVPDRAHDALFTARVTPYPDAGFAVHLPDACR